MDPNGAAILAVGWTGNAFYFARFLVQWLVSERAKRSVAPASFWWCSLGGALCLGYYSYVRAETALLFGYIVTFFIYLRNVTIEHLEDRAGSLGRTSTTGIALAALALLTWAATTRETDASVGTTWLVVAFVGQAIFSSRFVVQWYVTERSGKAHFPRVFWWLSLVGNLMILAYAIRRADAVFVAGFVLGPFVQIRNLMLPRDERTASTVAA